MKLHSGTKYSKSLEERGCLAKHSYQNNSTGFSYRAVITITGWSYFAKLESNVEPPASCVLTRNVWWHYMKVCGTHVQSAPNSFAYMFLLEEQWHGNVSPGISLTNNCRGVGDFLLFRAMRPFLSERIVSTVSLYQIVIIRLTKVRSIIWHVNIYVYTKHLYSSTKTSNTSLSH